MNEKEKPMNRRKVLEFAKAQGYDDVRHIGKWRRFDTWEPFIKREGENEFPKIGLPFLILVKGDTIRMSTEDEAFLCIEEENSMTMTRPDFVDSPFFVDEPGNWHLKPGAPQEVQDEFDAFMQAADRGEQILKFESEQMMIHQAILFATQAHNGQFRKGTDIPYITHPFEVAQILTENGCEAKLIVAGLLHDTLEDADVTPEQIENQFGKEILSLVQSDSENKSLSWEERKQETIDYLSQKAGMEELLLACADKLSNLRSIKADYSLLGDNLWSRFNRGKEQQAWYYSKVIDTFEPLHDYDMYWEISNLYTDIFVAYYIDGNAECLYQSNGQETYCFQRNMCNWMPITVKKWATLQKKSSLHILPKAEANQIEDEWQADYPSAMCLVQNRNDSHVIVRYAEKLLEEGHTPDTIGAIWDNMGGGIPAETLKAVECAFLAIYKNAIE